MDCYSDDLVLWHIDTYRLFNTESCLYVNVLDVQWDEINIPTYDNFYFLSFKHSMNKMFIYFYSIRIYPTNMWT